MVNINTEIPILLKSPFFQNMFYWNKHGANKNKNKTEMI